MRSLALIIKNRLLDLEVKVNVTVRQKQQELHILLESTYFGDRQMLMVKISQCLDDFDRKNLQTARVYAFLFGQPLPQWNEIIYFSDEGKHHHIHRNGYGNLDQEDNQEVNRPEKSVPVPTVEPMICDRFIVCGLGSLGQHTVFNLKKFAYREYAVKICAIDKSAPEIMEFDNLYEFLDEPLIVGDCRRSEMLLKAGIHDCRAIVLATSNENVNIETAIAARRLNPDVHIVVRSSRQSLNQLLKEQLGNFVALDPVELPAASFAVASLGEGTLGLFQIGDRKLRIVEADIHADSYRFLHAPAYLLHKKQSRLLSIVGHHETDPQIHSDRLFFQWQPDRLLQVGDRVALIECMENDLSATREYRSAQSRTEQSPERSLLHKLAAFGQRQLLSRQFWQAQITRLQAWLRAKRSRQLILWGIIIALLLWMTSSIVLFLNVPNISWQKAISTSMILLLGGFGDVFGGLAEDQVPTWVVIFCLAITLVSLLFVLGVIGLIADTILSSKFEFFKRSLPLPTRDHIVLIGFGRLGQRVADLLFKLQIPFVIVSENPHDCDLADKVPWFTGNIIEEVNKTNLGLAKSLISVTDDQMLNLEAALLAREATKKNQRRINLAIRTYDRYFSDNLAELLPSSQSLCAYALSAEAFAGAAFGENMLNLFRLNQRTVLVAEYVITANDTLVGKNLSQIAYGYTVVPIYLKTQSPKADGHSEFYVPSDDEVMKVGDRLIILASISGLRRIELGNLHAPKRWQLRAKPPLNSSVLLDAGNKLKNISGCDLETARRFMESLPAAIELPMYDTQAYRLGQALMRLLPIKIYPL